MGLQINVYDDAYAKYLPDDIVRFINENAPFPLSFKIVYENWLTLGEDDDAITKFIKAIFLEDAHLLYGDDYPFETAFYVKN